MSKVGQLTWILQPPCVNGRKLVVYGLCPYIALRSCRYRKPVLLRTRYSSRTCAVNDHGGDQFRNVWGQSFQADPQYHDEKRESSRIHSAAGSMTSEKCFLICFGMEHSSWYRILKALTMFHGSGNSRRTARGTPVYVIYLIVWFPCVFIIDRLTMSVAPAMVLPLGRVRVRPKMLWGRDPNCRRCLDPEKKA